MKLVERIGPADANILITGENGTGKEVIARAAALDLVALGKASGVLTPARLRKVFSRVNCLVTCAAHLLMPRRDRVGRFELADGGTLFLDEIANVPLNLQAKLLRVLETGEFERVGSSKTRKVNVRVLVGDER